MIIDGWDDSLDPTTAPYGVLMASPSKYWDSMTPEERSAEMKRRRAVTKNGAKSLKKPSPKKIKKGKRKYVKKAQPIIKNAREDKHEGGHNGEAQAHVSYLFGRIENEIQHYANSNDLSFKTLAFGVAELLRR